MRVRFSIAVLIATAAATAPVWAQGTSGPGTNWNSSYGWPSANDRAVRLQFMEAQRRLENGLVNGGANGNGSANGQSITYNTTNIYDHSVGEMMLSAAEGAHITIENRTGPDSGTNTSTVGSINTTTSTISMDGNDNAVDFNSVAQNTGCLDGSINMAMNQIFSSLDISASATPSGAGSSTAGGCNG